ncbi:c-type cytochrome [Pseudomonas sp. PSKL.D1]|uniref:c-type cytochrome n=1 Tax=Pseudomonas sp. PSKL.D1 TaxID=3029060 RepID=UPI0023816565|nr:cytochrome c [Pseudomonas sp. PSKL.D1]WDY55803.1 cytochrome c [Pseudomonas sp. PSKL.D1]
MKTLHASVAVALLATAPALWADDYTNPALIKQGEYLARAGDCVACHTAKDGKPYAGGLPMATPIGTIFATNITPDPTTGIGQYTLEDFDKAVRHGVTKAGYTLYPAMPYPSYAKVTDVDLKALYAYFMHGVEPVNQANRESEIPWPLSMRWPLGIWRNLFAPAVEPMAATGPLKYDDAQIARGAYLVQGLGHCGSCHTPRALTLQEKSLDERAPTYLAGGQVIDGWVAISLRANAPDGLGGWREQDIVQTLRDGRNAHFSSIGAMNDVIQHSGQYLTDQDLLAIARYLKSLPDVPGSDKVAFKADDTTAKALWSGESPSRGAELYVDNCAACHRTDGLGYQEVFPRLAGNPSVLSEDPSSMIRVILGGSRLPSTQQAPSDLVMPDFSWRLNDQEAAQLVSFIRNSWGNKAPHVTAEQVQAVRRSLAEEHPGIAASDTQKALQH